MRRMTMFVLAGVWRLSALAGGSALPGSLEYEVTGNAWRNVLANGGFEAIADASVAGDWKIADWTESANYFYAQRSSWLEGTNVLYVYNGPATAWIWQALETAQKEIVFTCKFAVSAPGGKAGGGFRVELMQESPTGGISGARVTLGATPGATGYTNLYLYGTFGSSSVRVGTAETNFEAVGTSAVNYNGYPEGGSTKVTLLNAPLVTNTLTVACNVRNPAAPSCRVEWNGVRSKEYTALTSNLLMDQGVRYIVLKSSNNAYSVCYIDDVRVWVPPMRGTRIYIY